VRKALRRGAFTISVDQAFREVILACGQGRPDGTWITPDVVGTYTRLHELGWAHSVEVWAKDGALVGGLYGLAIGGAFAGESMFHRRPDASKAAFVALVERLQAKGFVLLDAQVPTDHLALLGCISVPRGEFLDRLASSVGVTMPFSED
jgi:leucyl/phenylalanyl-tRNA--protein transferase